MDRSQPDLHLDVLKASLEFSSLIGAECMVYHPGRFLAEEEFAIRGPHSVNPDEKRRLMELEAEILQRVADAFPHVTIGMENARPYLYHSPYCYAEFPQKLVQQIKCINRPNVGMTLDFGHLHLSANFYGFDEGEAVAQAASDIVHCHVHDNFGRSVYFSEKQQTHQLPFGRGDSHMPVGWGNINFKDLFSHFITDYRGILVCELRSRYFDFTQESMSNLHEILC